MIPPFTTKVVVSPRLITATVLLALASPSCGDPTGAPTITGVAFDTDAVTLLTEDSVSTHVTVTNSANETVSSPTVKYSTSAGYIATVDATGKIHAVAPGTATITAAVGTVKDELQVTVNWPPVQSVDLEIANANVFVEDTVATNIVVLNSKLKPAPNARVTYTTSAPLVATVDAIGRISGVGDGTATITATAEGVSDQIQVIVAWPPVTSLAFSRDTATLLLDDSLATSVVVMNSRGRVARNAVITYASSANGVATIGSDGKIRTQGVGAATLTATVGTFSDAIGLTVAPHFTSIALGEVHTCGISGIGGLWCWGLDAAGQLGQGHLVQCVAVSQCSMVPLRVPPPTGNLRFVSSALGVNHSCALTDTGAAYCWGSNALAQLGNGSTSTGIVATPTAVSGGLTFKSLYGGRWHTCGITTTDETYCWGWDWVGQLGTGVVPTGRCDWGNTQTPCSRVPIKVVGNKTFVDIQARESATCGRTVAGEIYCWGLEVGGTESTECQTDPSNNRCTRTPLLQASGATYAGLLVTGGMICGRSSLGALSCWGFAYSGEFGNGSAHTNTATPIAVAGGAAFAQSVPGRVHLCARETDNSVKCWGASYDPNDTAPRLTPTPLPGGILFSSLFGSPNAGTTCGLSVAGRAYCWGDGRFGELGNNAALSSAQPVLVKLAR